MTTTPETVTRYVATYIGSDGLRTIVGPAQGRNTFASPEEQIDIMRKLTALELHKIRTEGEAK